MQIRSFQDLIVWQKAMTLAKLVYLLCEKLPSDQRYGLISQMQRCAVSIPSNIAEGSKRGSVKDFAQFLRIARGSAAELETQLFLAGDIYSLDTAACRTLLKEVQKMLEVLIKRLLKTAN